MVKLNLNLDAMKNWIICICLIFFGCKGDSNKEVESNGIIAEASMWSEYRATENAKKKNIVLVSGDEEYRSEEALPQLAKILSERHGFDCTVLFAQDPEKPGIVDPNYSSNIPGLEKLQNADLMILFTRFRSLPAEQMKYIDDYLLSGKPIIGIRTSTHAFNFKDGEHPYAHYGYNYNGPKKEWKSGFGKFVLGETWYTHHGHHKYQSTRGYISEKSRNHSVLNGIVDGEIWGPTDVYGVREPISDDAESLVLGQSIERESDFDESDPSYGMKESDIVVAIDSKHRQDNPEFNPNQVMPPIVWTKSYQLKNGLKGKSMTSTIGSSTDMLDEEVRRLYINGAYFLLDMKVPQKANVDLVGDYNPSAFAFHDDEYWAEKRLVISDLK
jgi:hypothetical protein